MCQFLSEYFQTDTSLLTVFSREDWTAPIASGSHRAQHMVVCPCTTGTLAAIANGNSDNLMERAADVMLKEQRKLILVVRETPFSIIHLENMLKLARAGATILPANPGFYHNPKTMDDLVDFVVARILDHIHIEHSLLPRWGES
jgi:4-hydroxy-3-polyprenylbenzoate decarboxylase